MTSCALFRGALAASLWFFPLVTFVSAFSQSAPIMLFTASGSSRDRTTIASPWINNNKSCYGKGLNNLDSIEKVVSRRSVSFVSNLFSSKGPADLSISGDVLDPLVRKYQNRSVLLEAALKQKSQQLLKYQRRLIVLQDLVKKNQSPSSIASNEVMLTKHEGNTTALLREEIERIKAEYEEKGKSYNATKQHLTGTVAKLRDKIFALEQLAANEQTFESDMKALEQQLQCNQMLYAKEKELRETDFEKYERDLKATNQETLKVEKILFGLEAELKTRQKDFDKLEAKLQAELSQERKQSKLLKAKLQSTQNKLKEALARTSELQNATMASSNLVPEKVFIKDEEGQKIAEAAVKASEKREAKLKAELADLDNAYNDLKNDNESLVQQRDGMRQQILTYKDKRQDIEEKLAKQRSAFESKKKDYELQAERLERTTENEEQIIDILEREKDKLSDMWMGEKKLRFSDLESQRSNYEQILLEERMARQVELDLMEGRLEKLKLALEMKKEVSHMSLEGGKTQEATAKNIIIPTKTVGKVSSLRRIGKFFRRLRERISTRAGNSEPRSLQERSLPLASVPTPAELIDRRREK
jgi:uncharacterized small protein (DUF1192 family)